MATYALLATFSYLVPKHVTCFNRFVISRNKSSTSDTTDGGSDDLHSEDANTPSTNSQKPNGRTHVNIQRIIWSLPSPTKRPMVTNYQCNHYVVCPPVLSNETMKPSKLQRHLKTTHAHFKYFFYTYFLFKIFRGPADLDETISQSVRASFKSLLSSCITCRSDQTAIHNCGKFNIANS